MISITSTVSLRESSWLICRMNCIALIFLWSKNINPYLIAAENVFIENRNAPISPVPHARSGNQGNYLFTYEEMQAFIKKEPKSEKVFRKWIGSHEFINRYYRYCLWLGETSLSQLMNMPNLSTRKCIPYGSRPCKPELL